MGKFTSNKLLALDKNENTMSKFNVAQLFGFFKKQKTITPQKSGLQFEAALDPTYLKNIKSQLKAEVAKDLGIGLKNLKKIVNPSANRYNDLLGLLARHNDNRRDWNNKIVTLEEYDQELNRIRIAALEFIDHLQDKDVNANDLLLKEVIKSLSLDWTKLNMGSLYLVNCDRTNLSDLHWNAFDNKSNQPVQFYFIPACPMQMPPSFAERMIWELIEDEKHEGVEEGIHYELRSNEMRVKPANFEIGSNIRRTKRAFERYFCQRFEVDDFQSLVFKKLPQTNYNYISSLLTLELEEWKNFVPDFLKWFIETFNSLPTENAPKYIFYIVIYIKGFIHKPLNDQQKKIIAEIKSVIESNSELCTVLKGFEPVGFGDMEKWFRDIGVTNPIKIKEAITAIGKNLPKGEQQKFEQYATIDMAYMETMQELVHKVANK